MLLLTGCSEGEKRYELVSINHMENINVEGSGIFFLWSVGVEKELNYWCYLKDSIGGIQLKEIPYARITFYEDIEKDESPYATTVYGSFYDIHIPKGSIKKKIDVDIFD